VHEDNVHCPMIWLINENKFYWSSDNLSAEEKKFSNLVLRFYFPKANKIYRLRIAVLL